MRLFADISAFNVVKNRTEELTKIEGRCVFGATGALTKRPILGVDRNDVRACVGTSALMARTNNTGESGASGVSGTNKKYSGSICCRYSTLSAAWPSLITNDTRFGSSPLSEINAFTS